MVYAATARALSSCGSATLTCRTGPPVAAVRLTPTVAGVRGWGKRWRAASGERGQ